ncbi:MAG: type II toxin-antitoxin system HicA family toxin [Deltaproteobacteria bacterium]|nr:type II toxin-antitoxin system HicA family toxin [Deltaproteobacteria bacterium]
MPKLSPVHHRVLIKVFQKVGFTIARQESSHIVMEKPGCDRPLVIPCYREVRTPIILSLLRTAKMSRKDYFDLLT